MHTYVHCKTVEATVNFWQKKNRQQFTVKTTVKCRYGKLLLLTKWQITVQVSEHCMYSKLL